jgi:Ca2+/Na+ antiporter
MENRIISWLESKDEEFVENVSDNRSRNELLRQLYRRRILIMLQTVILLLLVLIMSFVLYRSESDIVLVYFFFIIVLGFIEYYATDNKIKMIKLFKGEIKK